MRSSVSRWIGVTFLFIASCQTHTTTIFQAAPNPFIGERHYRIAPMRVGEVQLVLARGGEPRPLHEDEIEEVRHRMTRRLGDCFPNFVVSDESSANGGVLVASLATSIVESTAPRGHWSSTIVRVVVTLSRADAAPLDRFEVATELAGRRDSIGDVLRSTAEPLSDAIGAYLETRSGIHTDPDHEVRGCPTHPHFRADVQGSLHHG